MKFHTAAHCGFALPFFWDQSKDGQRSIGPNDTTTSGEAPNVGTAKFPFRRASAALIHSMDRRRRRYADAIAHDRSSDVMEENPRAIPRANTSVAEEQVDDPSDSRKELHPDRGTWSMEF
jgi:hypothetical protein